METCMMLVPNPKFSMRKVFIVKNIEYNTTQNKRKMILLKKDDKKVNKISTTQKPFVYFKK